MFFVHHDCFFFSYFYYVRQTFIHWYFHGHLQNRLIYSIVIVWLHIILLLQKLLPPWYLLNTGGLYDSGFGFDKGLQTLWTVPTSVYTIDILALCCYIVYPCEFIEETFLNPESIEWKWFSALSALFEGNPQWIVLVKSQWWGTMVFVRRNESLKTVEWMGIPRHLCEVTLMNVLNTLIGHLM